MSHAVLVFALPAVAFGDAASYSIVVTNALGAVTSQVATLTVLPLRIAQHPQPQNIRLASNATFTVSVDSPVPVRYQWRRQGTNLPSATGPALTLTNVQLVSQGTYLVEVSNEFGSALSDPAALVVLIDPVITFPPVSHSVAVGGNTTFSVAFTGNPSPFGVEWRQGSRSVASKTVSGRTDFFKLTNAQATNAGTWRVIVRNPARNTVTGESRTFNLTVLPDSDGDGLPDAWELAHGLNPNRAADAALDADSDGLTNGQEYPGGDEPDECTEPAKVRRHRPAGRDRRCSPEFRGHFKHTIRKARNRPRSGSALLRVCNFSSSSRNRWIESAASGGELPCRRR